jgi:hypothetical protein
MGLGNTVGKGHYFQFYLLHSGHEFKAYVGTRKYVPGLSAITGLRVFMIISGTEFRVPVFSVLTDTG